MAIFYLDYENGNDSNDGLSWATAWKTITNGATANRIAPGDVIRIAKSPPPVSIGNATWTNMSKIVSLVNAQIANIVMCEENWVASANVIASLTTTRKEGNYAISLAIADAFTTGKIAYKELNNVLDLSGYQRISFWIWNSSAINANCLKVVLCSDTTGDTIVDTFYIPAIPSTNRWLPLTIARNGGGNLGSSIRSIAVYADTDPGVVTLLLDDFIACTTNGLNLQSLISKNSQEQGGAEGWYAIQSINGTTIMLDNETNTLANSGRGYSGITETVQTYKRETIKTALALSVTTIVQEVQDSGIVGNNIEFQGGWNPSTNEQDGETFFDGLNGNGYGLYLYSKSYVTLNYLSFCRYHTGIYNYSSNNTIIVVLSNANNNTSAGINFYGGNNNVIDVLYNANNNGNYGLYFSSYAANNIVNLVYNANNNWHSGISFGNSNNNIIYTALNVNNNGAYGVFFYVSFYNIVKFLSTFGNAFAGVVNNYGINYIFNALIAEATEVSGFVPFANASIFSQNHDQTIDNHIIFTDGGQIHSDTSIRHTTSGISWRFDVTSVNRNLVYPLRLIIARIACSADSQVTVKAWFRRNNTGIVGRLVCKGKQIAGVDNDVYADMTVGENIWEQLQIQFQPTENGVVEIEAQAWGGNSWSIWVDDLEISQS